MSTILVCLRYEISDCSRDHHEVGFQWIEEATNQINGKNIVARSSPYVMDF